MALNRKNWVIKRNALNEMYVSNMTLQELRLFSVYLSCIDPKDENTNYVRFSLAELQTIMNTKKKNVAYFKSVIDELLVKRIAIDEEDGPYNGYTLFSRISMERGKHDKEWYIGIYAGESILHLLFNFKSHYFRYQLWNALNLKGKNQLRMYELLKQYENIGWRVITLEKLRGWLGISEGQYRDFHNFKRRVLIKCQQALAEHTDISFDFEPTRKIGKQITELKFTITKNVDYKDPLNLEELIDLKILNKTLAAEEAEENNADIKTYGKYGHVKMDESDFNDLVNEYGLPVIERNIQELEDYQLSKGITSENYAAAIRRWIKTGEDFRQKAVIDVKTPKRNRFANFEGRKRDYKEIERLEQEYLMKNFEEVH